MADFECEDRKDELNMAAQGLDPGDYVSGSGRPDGYRLFTGDGKCYPLPRYQWLQWLHFSPNVQPDPRINL